MNGSGNVVFFDIGNTLGVPTGFDAQGRLVGLKLYLEVKPVLEKLRTAAIRTGIISNTSESETTENMQRVLEEVDIFDIFEPDLLLYSGVIGIRKDSARIFRFAAERAGLADNPEQCLFVGENLNEGAFAQEAGFRYVPHPLLLEGVLDDEPLRFVKIQIPEGQETTDWVSVLSELPLVPLRITGAPRPIIYAMTSSHVVSRLDDLGFEVTRLGPPGAPQRTQLYLVRDDRSRRTGFLSKEGQSTLLRREQAAWIMESSGEGLIIALPVGESIDHYHFEEALHGHTVKLSPDPALLRPFGVTPMAASAPTGAAFRDTSLSASDRDVLARIRPDVIQRYLNRYSQIGSAATEGLSSRHIVHPENLVAVERAVEDFKSFGLSVQRHAFTHDGQTLFNVEAELAGQSDELILITAHLDSTAAFDGRSYDPSSDPAPGADDDASGTSAVIAIAEAIMAAGAQVPLVRTIRFVLFNAEEQGLVGSQAYARDLAAFDAPIVAVYQMDMIGYRDSQDLVPRPFEIHVGHPSNPEVEERSLQLADRVGALVETISPNLRAPQIYRRNDPAAGRSDHSSFQERGYAACITSEDFFAGPRFNSPDAQPNPNYHQSDDVVVNFEYASDISRVIGAAALSLAREG